MDVGAAEELLRNKCGITAKAVWQVAGALILIAEAILLFSAGFCWFFWLFFFFEKMCQF